MTEPATLRVVSDGTVMGTQVFIGDSPLCVPVRSIEWRLDAADGQARAVVVVDLPAADIAALNVNFRPPRPPPASPSEIRKALLDLKRATGTKQLGSS